MPPLAGHAIDQHIPSREPFSMKWPRETQLVGFFVVTSNHALRRIGSSWVGDNAIR